MNYYAVRCTCGKYRALQADDLKDLATKTLKCFYCNKSTKVKKKGEFEMLKKSGPYMSIEIAKAIQILNMPVKA